MKHFGDITKLSGYDLPVVDIITGGSPCQDLSVAGKRAGLAGERSGLFMEQIRVVKEMRERDARDNGRTGFLVRPRYMVWENVPGAFSSNGGKDFQAVIEEIIKVAEPCAAVDVCVPDGGWTKSGCYYAEDGSWSIAWRVHDAQFWGVPQRRKRIALVADFGGLTAPEILFERNGLSRDSEPGGAQGQGAAAGAKSSAGSTSYGIDFYNQTMTGMISKTLNNRATDADHVPCTLVYAGGAESGAGSTVSFHLTQDPITSEDVTPCLSSGNPQNGQASIAVFLNALQKENEAWQIKYSKKKFGEAYQALEPTVLAVDAYNHTITGEIAATLSANLCETATRSGPSVLQTYAMQAIGEYKESDSASLCKMRDYKDATDLCRQGSTVRRLTPLECERLQGYPDGWTDIGEWTDSKGKKHKEADSPRYKALGNSIALPFWAWMARRICAQYERPMTMASLFDGIGGFPLVFSRAGATPVWASEIEEFPIAVTKLRFPEVEP